MVTTNTSTMVAMQVRIVRTLLRSRFLKIRRRNFIVAFTRERRLTSEYQNIEHRTRNFECRSITYGISKVFSALVHTSKFEIPCPIFANFLGNNNRGARLLPSRQRWKKRLGRSLAPRVTAFLTAASVTIPAA